MDNQIFNAIYPRVKIGRTFFAQFISVEGEDCFNRDGTNYKTGIKQYFLLKNCGRSLMAGDGRWSSLTCRK